VDRRRGDLQNRIKDDVREQHDSFDEDEGKENAESPADPPPSAKQIMMCYTSLGSQPLVDTTGKEGDQAEDQGD